MRYTLTAATVTEVLEILSNFSGFTFLKDMCNRNGGEAGQDLYQDLFLIIADYPPSKILDIFNRGEMQYFCSGIIINQTHSNTSPFYKQYKKPLPVDDLSNILDGGNIEKNIMLDDIERALSKLGWYEQEIFKMYFYERKSLRAITREIKVPHTSIHITVQDTIAKIKKELGIPPSKTNLSIGCSHSPHLKPSYT